MNLLHHIICTLLSKDIMLLLQLLHANLQLIGGATKVWSPEHDIGINWAVLTTTVSCSSIWILLLLLLLHLSEKLGIDLGLRLCASLELLLLILLVLRLQAIG